MTDPESGATPAAEAGGRTLGELLDATARRLSARHTPAYRWASGLARVFDRAAQLSAPHEERFERVETPPDGPAVALPAIGLGGRPAPDGGALLRGGPGRRRGTAPERRAAQAERPAQAEEGAGVDGEAAASAGRPLPADVRSRLRRVAGPAADALRVHDDSNADALARAHRADAVTVGRDVHFRAGRYAERQERTFGLLAHEAMHVRALLEPPASWRRATARGRAEEESAARDAERAAGPPALPRRPVPLTASNGSPPIPPPAPPAVPAIAAGTPAGTANAPMRAVADRATAPPPPDLEELRRTLVDDLMRRLRTEFERGA
jgi:hypothetical protein